WAPPDRIKKNALTQPGIRDHRGREAEAGKDRRQNDRAADEDVRAAGLEARDAGPLRERERDQSRGETFDGGGTQPVSLYACGVIDREPEVERRQRRGRPGRRYERGRAEGPNAAPGFVSEARIHVRPARGQLVGLDGVAPEEALHQVYDAEGEAHGREHPD